jgi:HSP20 family molecular chaperone IbpA
MPGMKKDDICIECKDNALYISGKREETKTEGEGELREPLSASTVPCSAP